MNWTYLSKNGTDEYIEMFARGGRSQPTVLETWNYATDRNPLVLRGIMKHKIIKQCWKDKRLFRYIDGGYFGNQITASNPGGWKHWHRIVPNNLQHTTIIDRPGDRLKKLNVVIHPRKHGSTIMIVAPDEKPCQFYGIDLDTWLSNTINTIQQHTDRPIVMRERTKSRTERKTNNVVKNLQDVHAVVTFNSIAATEAVLAGVPAFVTAPCNAALPVSNTDLTTIDNPWFPDSDHVHRWASHLAYGQFHITELENGTAHKILDETEEILTDV